jgi:hypothetical protein
VIGKLEEHWPSKIAGLNLHTGTLIRIVPSTSVKPEISIAAARCITVLRRRPSMRDSASARRLRGLAPALSSGDHVDEI